MTQKKDSDSQREALAAAETRMLDDEDEARDDSGAGVEQAQPVIGDEAEAATVLASEDDRTVVASPASVASGAPSASGASTGSSPDQMATRVIDPAAPPAISSSSNLPGSDAETRVLDVTDDKTPPPPVSVRQGTTPESAGGASPPPPTPIDSSTGLTPGMILFGEYEIENVLGVGGMGEVYRARHRRLDEHRAIKVMHSELAQKKGASEFFYREAKALLAVRHPAVVHCHDLLSDDAGRVYLIMEMIEGIPLSKKMNDGPLSPDDVAILGARVAHGLSAAHRKGVIHRDVSPDNIVLPNGRVREAKLIDFGIAKILQEGEGTIIDGFKGKLSYASPEQLGFFGGKIDGRSDFYSLGLVLVAAALGRPMGMGTTVMEAVDARRAFDSLPDEIPVGLRSAIAPLLKLDPDDRPKYVDRLFIVPGGIEGATDPGRYAEAGIRSGGETATKPSALRVGLFAGIAAGVLLLAGVGFYFATSGGVPATDTLSAAIAVAPDAALVPGPDKTAEAANVIPDESPPIREVVPAKVTPPPKATIRRLTASDRIKIIGLLSSAKLALSENQLMSPANDNAYDRYRRVLALDPTNKKARDGLRAVSDRYLELTNSAANKGNVEQAQTFLARAKKADSTHPGVASAESRLSR
jgi:serine/threonine protein kinase